MEDIYDPTITPKVIEENLKLVKDGKPLKLSLKVLGPEFKKRYKEEVGEFEWWNEDGKKRT